VETYTSFVKEQVKHHKLEDRLNALLNKASKDNNMLSQEDIASLNTINKQLTQFMLAGEQKCSKKANQRQFWSPHQKEISRMFSYWKQKSIMEAKKLINWQHLNNLRTFTSISEVEHLSLDPTLISNRKRESRSKWRTCKKHSEHIRAHFLSDRAELMAQNVGTSEEKALKAIIKAEASRRTCKNINYIFGKQQIPLTQIDVPSTCGDPTKPHISLTFQLEIEEQILQRNRRHSLQSLTTPFISDPVLRAAIDPTGGQTQFDKLMDGSFLRDIGSHTPLSPTEQSWIAYLKKLIHQEIPLSLSCKDF
jgi:hypothetical protein